MVNIPSVCGKGEISNISRKNCTNLVRFFPDCTAPFTVAVLFNNNDDKGGARDAQVQTKQSRYNSDMYLYFEIWGIY